MRSRFVVALLLLLGGAAVQATVVVGVEASHNGVHAQASEAFEAPVDRVYGLASASGIGGTVAIVGTVDHGCSGSCGSLPGSHAIAEMNAEQMRWRVHTKGANGDATAGFSVTDELVNRGPIDPLRPVELNVRIELGMSAERGNGAWAGAAFSYVIKTPDQGLEQPGSVLFEFLADVNDVLGEGQSRHYSVSMFGAEPVEGSDIPSIFEATFLVPWFIGMQPSGDFGLVTSGSAGGSAADGVAVVASYDSSWLGIRIGGELPESRNGYGYVGFVPGAPAVPEPSGLPLLLAAIALGACATCRRPRARR